VIGVAGASALWWWVGGRPSAWTEPAVELTARVCAVVAFAAALIGAAALPLRLYLQAAGFAFEGDPVLPLVPRVFATTWGRAFAVQVAAVLVAVVGAALATRLMLSQSQSPAGAGAVRAHDIRARRAWLWIGAAGAALAVTPAFMGHAIATASSPTLAIVADAVHVAASSAWTGGVLILALACASVARQQPSQPGGDDTRLATRIGALAELIGGFKPFALGAAATLVASGAISSWLRLGAPAELFGSDYGRILLVKIALVACAAALGRKHSATAATQVSGGKVRDVARSIGLEVAFLVLVVAATALLSGSPPPGE